MSLLQELERSEPNFALVIDIDIGIGIDIGTNADADADIDWTIVQKKQKLIPHNKPHLKPRTQKNITFDEIKCIIERILKAYHAKAAFVFGSVARKSVNPHDIDILVIWKKNKSCTAPINVHDVHLELEKNLNYPVDLVSMIYDGREQLFDSRCECFIRDNIIPEAIPIFGDGIYLIERSMYCGKCQ